jgi:hypothetical protein
MATREITCPSGLAGTVRGLTVAEAEVLTDRRLVHEGLVPDKVLGTAWEDTTDTGPYDVKENGTINWDHVLVCDRFFALMMVRVATYGPEYEFKVGCQGCKQSIEWGLNLEELPTRAISEESLEVFKKDNRHRVKVGNRTVVFQLLNGAKERKAQKALRGSKNRLVTALAQRITEIEGEKNKMLWIRNLPMQDAVNLIESFDEHDGGVETAVDIICPECGMVQGVALPFDRPEFWLPLKRTDVL